MHKKYNIAPLAQKDLAEILRYIAQDNLSAARKVRAKFSEAFLLLAERPHIGSRREDITFKPVRFWNVHSYQIIYSPETEPLEVVRILSGYRDLSGMLEN